MLHSRFSETGPWTFWANFTAETSFATFCKQECAVAID